MRSGARQGIPCHISGHSYAGDLQDAVPDLFGQHELRVRGHAHQDLVELEVAAGAGADHATFAQQVARYDVLTVCSPVATPPPLVGCGACTRVRRSSRSRWVLATCCAT